MELYLSHNPYTIETYFSIDGDKCNAAWFTNLTQANGMSSRLQMWIMRFFDELHNAYPTKEKFYLTFKGTSTDCQDIKEEAKSAESRLGIQLVVDVKPCGDPENKFKQLQALYQEALAGPYDDFKTLELKEDFNKISDRKLSVSVMAPMKNGKSTLLNAILGQELLPNATQRCTAKISYIEHSPMEQGFEAKRVNSQKESSDYVTCTKDILNEWNFDDEIRNVLIRGKLPGISISDYRLQFVDTPGPDSAAHPEDKTTIERFLNDTSLPMVCYIIDRVNTSETHYLERLRKHMSQYGKQSEDRFIFIVSRMDQLVIDKTHSYNNNPIKTKVDDIRHNLQELGIKNPRIFPVSAWIALKAREYNFMEDEDDQEDAIVDFKKFRKAMKRINASLMDYMSVSPSIKNRLSAELRDLWKKIDEDTATIEDHLRLVEILSGVPALEAAIEEYLLKYSVPARIYDTASIFDAKIKQANAEKALLDDIASKNTSLDEISKNITKLREFLSKGKGAQELKSQIFPQKWEESATLKKELSANERDFDIQIREKIADMEPITLDARGTISPEESTQFINDFIKFMKGLQNEMLGVYANAVETDTRSQFAKLKDAYDEKIKTILGQMPEELKNFMNRFDFVLRGTNKINVKANEMIVSVTEEYIEKVQREYSLEKDGFWKKFWSLLPLTATTLTEDVTKTRVINRVVFKDLKARLKREASNILQEGLEKAKKMSETHYMSLRSTMLGEFEKVDKKLKDFNEDLRKKLSSQQEETEKLKEYETVLTWVKQFQDKLSHILDLEVK